MKKLTKGIEPELLTAYREANPTNEWRQFKKSSARTSKIQTRLKKDQGGLCAYCEIDLIESSGNSKADFRVEHFHPKSDDTDLHNWHLDWQNLLGCCNGGSQSDIVDAGNRFTSPDHSCDVPKNRQNLDDVILNPLKIPAFPCLFSCDRASGAFSINVDHCRQASISIEKAQNTIDKLRLDSNRLRRLRKATLNQLNAQLREFTRQGLSMEQAFDRLAKVHLRKNSDGYWPKFFTSIRSYLGWASEKQLKSINFDG